MNAPDFKPEDTIERTLAVLTRLLSESDLDEPRREARHLLAAALDLSQAEVIAHPEARLGTAARRLAAMTRRRMAHEPLSRILGRRGFMDLELAINPATLDPRPETEHLVEAVLAALDRKKAVRLLDLGTGSGAILIALLSGLPEAFAIGVDRAEAACMCARANALSAGVSDRAAFICGDLGEALAGGFDVVVSNPPYIPSGEIAGLSRAVRAFDPVLALDGGTDGLDFYRRLAHDGPRLLRPGGLLALEIGAGQAQAVREILALAGFYKIVFIYDYSGHLRVALARAPVRTR